jgi:HD superfamily phosphohydrolase
VVVLETNRIDYIYDYVEVDKEDLELLSDSLVKGLERLRFIQHLGVVGEAFPLARHDKLEHAYGVYWLCKLTRDWARGLNTNDKALRLAGLLHGVGHAPWTYTTEQAILQLYWLHEDTRRWLDAIFERCVRFIGNNALQDEAQHVVSVGNFYALYPWLTVARIASTNGMDNQLGKHVALHLLDSRLFGHKLLRTLDRVDYTLRDLHYLGTARIHLNIGPFLRGFHRKPDQSIGLPPFNDVVEAAHRSLVNEVYRCLEVRWISALACKAMVKAVIDGHTTAEELTRLTDEDLVRFLAQEAVPRFDAKQVLDRVRKGNIVHVVSARCTRGRNPIDGETAIAGVHKKRFYSYPRERGVIVDCIPSESGEEEDDLQVNVGFDLETGKVRHAIGAVFRCEGVAADELESATLSHAADVFSFLFGMRVRVNFEPYEADVERTAANVLRKVVKRLRPEEAVWDKDWDMWEWGKLLCEIESETESGNLAEMAKHFVQYPNHFTVAVCEAVYRAMKRTRRRKGEANAELDKRRQRRKEYRCYLDNVLKQKRSGRRFWALPSVIMLDGEGRTKGEFDVVVVSVRRAHGGPVLVDLHEVTESNTPVKRREAEDKFERMERLIRQRFGARSGIQVRGWLSGERVWRR